MRTARHSDSAAYSSIARSAIASASYDVGATWAFFAIAPMHPLVGHWVWIGGIVLILSPEANTIIQGWLAKDKEATVKDGR